MEHAVFAKEEIRQEMQKDQMNFAREAFIRYILKIDAGRVGIPQNPIYSQIAMARRQIEALLPRRPHRMYKLT
jgi:hypothetical protein